MTARTTARTDVAALKSRWMEIDPATGQNLAQQMVQRLRKECRKGSPDRPIKLDLRGLNLINEELPNMDLSGYDLSYAGLTRCNLTGTNFSYSFCYGTEFDQATLDECEFIGSDLTNASLNEGSAKHCGFGGADLSNASMINLDLRKATLSRSTLVNTDLRAANLTKARLTEADLSNAIFTRANLQEGDLKHSRVQGTDFELANLRRARLLGIKGFKTAKWVGADIRELDLRGAYLVRRYIADENYLFEFQSRSQYHRLIYLVWWATSDCGRSLFRWFIWLLVATLVFAGIYTVVDIDYGEYATPFSPIYFSFVTLTTLGYGDALPASLAAQIFVTLQAISGYMGLGGLLSILGNKMARRAE